MRSATVLLAAAALLFPGAASAQEQDVTRRTYTFLDNRLDVAVTADAPGVLHVVRGQRGRIEVAARSRDGFPGFGLGGTHTRQLQLTAVGSESVQYLVVVPERVSVRVRLPQGGSVTLAPHTPNGRYSWGATEPVAVSHGSDDMPLPTLTGGLFLAYRSVWAPGVLDLRGLESVRSLSVRFEGTDFRLASSRPLSVTPGSRSLMRLDLAGEPVDLVLYVPRGRAPFTLRSGNMVIAEQVGGTPRAVCDNVIIQSPTEYQTWLTFRTHAGRLDCR
jgi:hypothetical protein